MSRARLRDLGVHLGQLPPGARNAITDVPGVGVGHRTVVHDEPRVARTGVTIVQLRPPEDLDSLCYGAMHSFNGNGEMTGSHWLAESGLLSGLVGITNTHQVGLVRDTLVGAEVLRDPSARWCLPIVGETYDGFLNDIDAFHLTAEHVHQAMAAVTFDAAVAEGNVGGGTGMICHEFKGGIGTSSRLVTVPSGQFTVADSRSSFPVIRAPRSRTPLACTSPSDETRRYRSTSALIIRSAPHAFIASKSTGA